ncbi:MAG: DMT family transporter [Alphaproteobacteria bacterium]|nr:DMT family transporter [Alphaproteobacteria bacterium]
MSARVWAMLLALSVLWGGSFFFSKAALAELPPFTIAVLRVAIAAAALGSALAITRTILPALPWRAFLVMGLLNGAIPFALIFWGLQHIPSGLGAILNATTPLFTLLVAHFATDDEKIGRWKLAGLAAGLAGVVVLVGHEKLGALGVSVLGQLACIAACVSYAFAGVYGRRFARMGIAPPVAAAGQLVAATVWLLPLALITETPWRLEMPSPATWMAILGLALLSTALAYVLYFRILAAAGVTNLLLVTFLIPASAIALGAVFLGERLEAHHFGGLALIGLGLALVDGRLFARRAATG